MQSPELTNDLAPTAGTSKMAVTFRRFVRHKVGMGALAVLLIVILVAIIVPPLWPYDHTDITPELSQSPSLRHPMGTDTLGRDLFALVLRGMQQSLLIAGLVTIIACVIGVVMGVAAGYFGRFVDAAVMRTVDLVLTLPTIALAAFLGSLVAGKGVSWLGLAMVLGALMWTSVARLVRGVVLGMRELAFVDAARVMGASPLRIMFRHLVPNASDHIVVSGTLMFGVAILAESSLSFLGFGVQPPDTSLGLLVANAQSAVLTRPWLFYFPGLLIITIVLAVNYVGEGLRDAFNPKSSPTNPLATPRRLRRRRPQPVSGDPDPSRKPLLRVSDLSVRFGEHVAVDAVSLEVEPGEVVALVGESGSGKSLTALSLVGLLPSNAVGSGSINFDGAELSGLSFAQWREYRGRRIAMILQDPSTTLNPVLTIGAQFADSMALAGTVNRAEARRRAIELMESVAIKDAEARLDQYPHQLSGGMRQRIAIALAMVHDPDLIIADEPTTALDVTVQAQVMATLALARERTGAAMLFITHDLALVAGIADRVAVMYQGEIVEQRDVFAIFDNPESDYTRKLLSLAPRITSQAVERQ
ncbi:dipeptide/oligopeptide/nickel ABC transporter permease/ATP-binding protein [Micromonospora sp. NPDC048170]|uniref:dipeptide/oligopeptide/nickel ABC transporter permease/ATP-binding protein n=1 Tax=Micromonospora sp. NPDC048170 TaxID=3154819 RepID=UPI0033C0F379